MTVYTTEVICDRVEFTRGSKGAERADTASAGSFKPVSEEATRPQLGIADLFDDLPDTFSAAEDDIPF